MKKILTILIVVTLLLTSCTQVADTLTPTKPEAIAKAFLQASDNNDIDVGLSLLSDDVVFRQEPLGIRVEGKAQLEAGLRENMAWHHQHTFTSPFRVDGEKVTCSAEVSGDDFRIIGIEHINATYEFLIHDGKIYSILVITSSEDWAKVVELTNGRIGVKIEFVEQGIKVMEFAKDSPAEEAGIELGDVITAVDGISFSEMREGEIILRIQGPVGSKVPLTIIHEGVPTPIDVEVTLVDFRQLHY